MKLFIKKLARSNLSIRIRNLIGFRPVPLNSNKLSQNFSVSDGFPWRTDNYFKTNFKYTDLLKVFYDEINSNVEIHFYDKNNNLIKKINKFNINISNNFLIDKEFLNGIEDYGIFYIYHKSDKKINSSIRNSCYTGFSYKNQLESYVHGNCPTSYKPLNPNINMWKVAKPIVENYIKENIGPKAFFKDFIKTVQMLSRFGPQLPEIMDNLKEKLDRTNIDKPNYNVSKLYWFVGGSLATVMIALIVFSI